MVGAQSSFDGSSYVPHSYLNRAVNSMKDYCLPDGASSIPSPETGAIVAITLYILAKELEAGRTKIECYLILLDRAIREATGSNLFNWTLTGKGLVRGFGKIYENMINKGLLLSNGYSRFYVLVGASDIIADWSKILGNLLPYLDRLLGGYGDYTATRMLKEI